jgi:hypothetical protein
MLAVESDLAGFCLASAGIKFFSPSQLHREDDINRNRFSAFGLNRRVLLSALAGLVELIMATYASMTTEEFEKIVNRLARHRAVMHGSGGRTPN